MPQYVWTYRLEEMLVRCVNREGCSWQAIRAKHFPQFSVTALKNKWQRLKALNQIDSDETIDDQRVLTKHNSNVQEAGDNTNLLELLTNLMEQFE